MHNIIESHKTEIEKICSKYKVSLEELISRRQTKEFKRPRVEILCYLRNKYNYTYERLWKDFWNRHYASIMYLIKHSKPKKQFNWRIDFSDVNL